MILNLIFSTMISLGFANGSVGVGNAREIIVGRISTLTLNDKVTRLDKFLVDKKTGEKILEITPHTQMTLSDVIKSGEYVSSNLGQVKGFEYLPRVKNQTQANHWLICDQESCVKVTPLSKSNPLVPALIGSLKSI